MTATPFPFEWEFITNVSSRIVNEVRGVSRVFFDGEFNSVQRWKHAGTAANLAPSDLEAPRNHRAGVATIVSTKTSLRYDRKLAA